MLKQKQSRAMVIKGIGKQVIRISKRNYAGRNCFSLNILLFYNLVQIVFYWFSMNASHFPPAQGMTFGEGVSFLMHN